MHYHPDDLLLNNMVAAGKNFHWIGSWKFYPVCLIYIVKNKEEETLTGWESKCMYKKLFIVLTEINNCGIFVWEGRCYFSTFQQFLRKNAKNKTTKNQKKPTKPHNCNVIPYHSSFWFTITLPVVQFSSLSRAESDKQAPCLPLPFAVLIADTAHLSSRRLLGTRGFTNPKSRPLAAAP